MFWVAVWFTPAPSLMHSSPPVCSLLTSQNPKDVPVSAQKPSLDILKGSPLLSLRLMYISASPRGMLPFITSHKTGLLSECEHAHMCYRTTLAIKVFVYRKTASERVPLRIRACCLLSAGVVVGQRGRAGKEVERFPFLFVL